MKLPDLLCTGRRASMGGSASHSSRRSPPPPPPPALSPRPLFHVPPNRSVLLHVSARNGAWPSAFGTRRASRAQRPGPGKGRPGPLPLRGARPQQNRTRKEEGPAQTASRKWNSRNKPQSLPLFSEVLLPMCCGAHAPERSCLQGPALRPRPPSFAGTVTPTPTPTPVPPNAYTFLLADIFRGFTDFWNTLTQGSVEVPVWVVPSSLGPCS